MRTFAEVYNPTGAKLAFITAITVATVRERLDQAGTVNLQCALDERVMTHLTNGNVVYVYAQQDAEQPSLWAAARIIKVSITETDNATGISIDCRDLIDELRDVTVGWGRQYTQQSLQTVFNGLVTLKTGWTTAVETAVASNLLTARYDGAKALRAIVRTAEETGLHFRMGSSPRVLEIGAFGDEAMSPMGRGVRCIKSPSSVTPDLMAQDHVLLCEDMKQVIDSDSLCNWALPVGAGEGAAATTLKNTSYEILNADKSVYRAGTAPRWPIYRRVNAFNIEEYYIDASDGGTQRQDTPSFKEIGPVANSDLGKQYASDALANATLAWLDRMRVALETYQFSVQHCPYPIRVGSQVKVEYTGTVPMQPGSGNPLASQAELRYMDVDEMMWVTGVTRSISESGLTQSLEVSTVDRYVMDDTDLTVTLAEQMQVQGLTVQTFPIWSENTYTDYVEYIVGGSSGRQANFKVEVDSLVTDLVKVSIRFKTRPFFVLGRVRSQYQAAGTNMDYVFNVIEGDQHPKGLHIYINGVDVSTTLGGPWNNGAGGTDNTALDVGADITSYLVSAGIYNEHSIVFKAEINSPTAYPVPGFTTLALNGQASSGIIELNVRILATARAIVPA